MVADVADGGHAFGDYRNHFPSICVGAFLRQFLVAAGCGNCCACGVAVKCCSGVVEDVARSQGNVSSVVVVDQCSLLV